MKLYWVLEARRLNYGVLTPVNHYPVSLKETQKYVLKAVKRNSTSVVVRLATKQCSWVCPTCGKRCGGVINHKGGHQCPTQHYSKN